MAVQRRTKTLTGSVKVYTKELRPPPGAALSKSATAYRYNKWLIPRSAKVVPTLSRPKGRQCRAQGALPPPTGRYYSTL